MAYFDGLGETIVSVGLVKPKPGVFHNFVKYLLVLTTTVEIVILGVTFSATKDGMWLSSVEWKYMDSMLQFFHCQDVNNDRMADLV